MAGPKQTLSGRRGVAASILVVAIVGAYFAASRGQLGALPVSFVISAVVLALAFWFPAMRIGAPRAVLENWRSLLVWILAWTLVWDLATAGVVGERDVLEEWWVVYPAGVLLVGALLSLHGAVVGRRA